MILSADLAVLRFYFWIMDYQIIIDEFYPEGTTRREIYIKHCRQVAELAMSINKNKRLNLSNDEVAAAAMLHDIGIFATDATDIGCYGEYHYIRHGIIGAQLLRERGVDEAIARVAERHTGAGISEADIIKQNIDMPLADYCPETLLEKLICYADKFYSKSGAMVKKDYERVRTSVMRYGCDSLARFDEMHRLFGDE